MSKIVVEKIPKIEGHLNFTVIMSEVGVKARAEALEGTRLLERLLIGKRFSEVPDIASRMCGVCQAIHKVTAVQALEDAFGIELPEGIEALRKIVAISGHLQSHILHLYLFVMPDFLGYRNIVEMLPDHEDILKKILTMKKLANAITEITGGRAVHPVTPIVGGFSKLPTNASLKRALELAKLFEELSRDVVEKMLSIEMPSFERKSIYVSLRNGKVFPLLRGDIMASDIGAFQPHEYEKHIRYVTEEYSMARHYLLDGEKEYLVGALARVNNNYELLSDEAKEAAKRFGLQFPSYRTFDNNKAQALEIIHFANEMISLLEYLLENPIKKSKVNFELKPGNGVSATEAPRGLLIHHYKINGEGRVEEANIITPTAQNYKNMEADVAAYVAKLRGEKSGEELKFEIEKLVRAYDPCISCSARFFREH